MWRDDSTNSSAGHGRGSKPRRQLITQLFGIGRVPRACVGWTARRGLGGCHHRRGREN